MQFNNLNMRRIVACKKDKVSKISVNFFLIFTAVVLQE